MNKLIVFNDWKLMQDAVNEIGWENFKLYNLWKRNHAWKRNGHLVMNMKDPRAGNDPIYLGYIYNDELAAIANVYLEHRELWIGDFEVSKFQAHLGIGRLFFNAIVDEYYDKAESIALTYLDMNAKLFWQKMGFKGNNENKIMTYSMKTLQESILYAIQKGLDNALNEGFEIRNRAFRKALAAEGLERIHLYLDNGYLWIWSDDESEDFRDSSFFLNKFGDQSVEDWVNDIKDRVEENLNEGECCDCGGGDLGGVSAPYNTPMNTVGVGDVVPATMNSLGSGDRFDMGMKSGRVSSKKGSKKRKKNKQIIYTKKGI